MNEVPKENTEEKKQTVSVEVKKVQVGPRNAKGQFARGINLVEGYGKNPKLTQEQKLIKRGIRKLMKKYEQDIILALPGLSSKLVEEARKGNMQAFDQIHKIVGAYKKDSSKSVTAVQVNINKDREEFA